MITERVLSNGRYRALVSAAGAGYSAFGRYTLVRWSRDRTRDADGWFLYLRDLASGLVWSAGHQPVGRPADRYQALLGEESVQIAREDDGVETRTEIRIAPDADVEWRRYTLTNRSGRPRRLELTTCAEVALNLPALDEGHPAFSKLFIQTEFLPGPGGLLARRRPRSPEEETLFLAHALFGGKGAPGYETDRARFVGRGRTLADPAALRPGTALSGTAGNVLDPVLALRRTVELPPGGSARFDAVLVVGMNRRTVERALAEAAAPGAGDRIFSRSVPAPAPAVAIPAPEPPRCRPACGEPAAADPSEPLTCFNGHGGFSAAGDEYVVRIDRTTEGVRLPPLAWTNVIANEAAGCIASERGFGATWCGNSRLNRLTPWFNDPVSDPAGEALYLRDEDAAVFWSPTPGPVPGSGAYETRHGFGCTSWRHTSRSLAQEVHCFVPRREPLRIVRLRVTNRGAAAQRLSVFSYAEWVLGERREATASVLLTESAMEGRAILAVNPAGDGFAGRVAFAAAAGPEDAGYRCTADRLAFLGRYGSTAAPAGVAAGPELEPRFGTGFDPCAAFQVTGTLAPGESAEWIFLLGQAGSRDEALALVERFRSPGAVERALEEVRAFWRETLSAVQVETPGPALDLMVNGWLPYQNLSCRMWARTALYQSGGAFGFRDQLQDAAALIYHRPELTRGQILLHAAHQFVEGDVLHWWHPPPGRGIRTRFSDDLLWLPYLTLFYVDTTGESALFDQRVRFITGPPLAAGEDEAARSADDAGTGADLFDHCCRAIDRSLTRGAHGLPLMGSGDWNDGMNRVGRGGRGESVWLGFFLFAILERFIPLCDARGHSSRGERYRAYRDELARALNAGGWDGAWYRRAYYDDGTPLGSADSDECRIDALAQAWAVLSGAAPEERANQALDAMEKHLVDERAGLIRLLAPPFDRTRHDPGYIKGYLPGVRENGGQYTHAALWAVRALALAGRAHRAAHLLELLNPVAHGDSPEAVETYKVEPYVVAADVYGVAPHLGRGGWTWYTGSAGWMFRVALESILGVTIREGRTLVLCPCIPPAWPGFTVRHRLPDGVTTYEIAVERVTRPTSVEGATGARIEGGAVHIPLDTDGRPHRIGVRLGPDVGPRYRSSASP